MNSIAMWVMLQKQCRLGWDCFTTAILREILRTQNILQVEHCAFLEVVQLFQKVGCARTIFSFTNSTKSKIICLDAGLRLDGIPALDWWDPIVLVLGNTTQNHDRTVRPVVCPHESRAPAISRSDQ